MTVHDAGAGPEQGPAPAAATGAGELWLLRHGETEWSRTHRHTGRTDVPLTERGEAQAAALAGMLAGLRPALVVTSPRQRAIRTAELAGLVPYKVDDDLSEWDYGAYEGLTTEEIQRTSPNWTIWSDDPPGGETAVAVRTRVDRVLRRLRVVLTAGPVVVVAHGHLGRVLAARWLGLGVAGGQYFILGPASPCVLGAEHGLPAVRRWNLPNAAEAELT